MSVSVLFPEDPTKTSEDPVPVRHATPWLGLDDLGLAGTLESLKAAAPGCGVEGLFRHPLHDADAIRYRQDVIRELDADAERCSGLVALCDDILSISRRAESMGGADRRDPGLAGEGSRLSLMADYRSAMSRYVAHRPESGYRSEGLNRFDALLTRTVRSSVFLSLERDIARLENGFQSLTFLLHLGHGSLTVIDRDDAGRTSLLDRVDECLGAFVTEFDHGSVDDASGDGMNGDDVSGDGMAPGPGTSEGGGPRHDSDDAVDGELLRLLSRRHREEFRDLRNVVDGHRAFLDPDVLRCSRELRFLLAWLDYVRPVRRRGGRMCLPEISAGPEGTRIRGGYDVAMAHGSSDPMVPNDLRLDGEERIVVVTGPNHDGKTTYARMVAQEHYLACLGLSVPGESARLPCCEGFLGYLGEEESRSVRNGRLRDDLLQVRGILEAASPRSVVVLNELFSSTTSGDARRLMRWLIGRLAGIGCLAVIVTFLDGLDGVPSADDGHGDARGHADGPSGVRRVVGMVAGLDSADPPHPTFLLTRGRGDRGVNARSLAQRWGLTAQAIVSAVSASGGTASAASMTLGDGVIDMLGMNDLAAVMAEGDESVLHACVDSFSHPSTDVRTILERQGMVADALRNPDLVGVLHAILVRAQGRRHHMAWRLPGEGPADVVLAAIEILRLDMETIVALDDVMRKAAAPFSSAEYRRLFGMVSRWSRKDGMTRLGALLDELTEACLQGVTVEAGLDGSLRATGYRLMTKTRRHWLPRIPGSSGSYVVPDHDAAGAADVERRRDLALAPLGSRLSRVEEGLDALFADMHGGLSFGLGCSNLVRRLHDAGCGTCLPSVLPSASSSRSIRGLYAVDLPLAGVHPVANDLTTSCGLLVVTGANQGGKTTFLRALGQAQLMMQCGAPVMARGFSAPVRTGLFIHAAGGEDSAAGRGRFEEELHRIRTAVASVRPRALFLFNEALSSTDDGNGSAVCEEITKGLVDSGVEVMHVTHLLGFCDMCRSSGNAMMLRAGRRDDGARTFRLEPGVPESTAFADDVFADVFSCPMTT